MAQIARVAGDIPTEGVVAKGSGVVLGWPQPGEYDLITELRNRSSIRRYFLDARPLDLEANREWLASGMRRNVEGLLSIRWS
jgi:hypothetical protein